jgi:hypothetical protein
MPNTELVQNHYTIILSVLYCNNVMSNIIIYNKFLNVLLTLNVYMNVLICKY